MVSHLVEQVLLLGFSQLVLLLTLDVVHWVQLSHLEVLGERQMAVGLLEQHQHQNHNKTQPVNIVRNHRAVSGRVLPAQQ